MPDSPIKFIQVRCPNCNAVMNLENYRTTAFCSYCGTQLLIHRENEQIYHKIDEAEIKKAEAVRDIGLKKVEYQHDQAVRQQQYNAEQQKQRNKHSVVKLIIIGIVVFYAIGVLGSLIVILFG